MYKYIKYIYIKIYIFKRKHHGQEEEVVRLLLKNEVSPTQPGDENSP